MRRAISIMGLLALSLCSPASAQESKAPAGNVMVQLNNAKTVGGGCQLTFAVRNDTGTAIDKSSYNMAIIDAHQQVVALVTFDFRPLPAGQTKVQQFGLPTQPCDQIAGLSINDFVECLTADGPSKICETNIRQSSLTPIEFPWELKSN